MATVRLERSELVEVREWLMRWGSWQQAIKVCNLNYSKKSNFVVSASLGVEEYESKQAQRVEAVMCQMKEKIHLPIQFVNVQSGNKHCVCNCVYCVLKQAYLFNESNVVSAQRLGISASMYKNKRLEGEYYVLGKMD